MKLIKIKHRITNAVLYTTSVSDGDLHPVRTALISAVQSNANLTDANLTGANLTRANLSGANLEDAKFENGDLIDANLSGANLTRANLTRANLSGANLEDAKFENRDLIDANLSKIRADIFRVLDSAPNEVSGLLAALREGRIDGSAYRGECACLIGTIANLRGCDYATLSPDSSRPSERWFIAITKGSIPSTNPVAAITEGWIVEWQASR